MNLKTALETKIRHYLSGALDLEGLYTEVAMLEAGFPEGVSDEVEQLAGAVMHVLHEVNVEGRDEDNARAGLTLLMNPHVRTAASRVDARITLSQFVPQYAAFTASGSAAGAA